VKWVILLHLPQSSEVWTQDSLLAYVRHRVTNAIEENLKGQSQRIKTNARGFRQFANFRVVILFFLGKLDLYPQTFR
jgi:transposase